MKINTLINKDEQEFKRFNNSFAKSKGFIKFALGNILAEQFTIVKEVQK